MSQKVNLGQMDHNPRADHDCDLPNVVIQGHRVQHHIDWTVFSTGLVQDMFLARVGSIQDWFYPV